MPDGTTSYGTPFDFIAFYLGIFINFRLPFISELLYLHQTFTDCDRMLDVTASYGMLSIRLGFFANFAHN